MSLPRTLRVAPIALAAALLFLPWALPGARAVPFRPDVLRRLEAAGRLEPVAEAIRDAGARGLDRPAGTARGWLSRTMAKEPLHDRQAIVILVDFSDKVADTLTYPSSHYVQMLFSLGSYPTGSMRDWFLENSYGTFSVTGTVTTWLRMPETYAFYVDDQAGFGTYPANAQKLAEDAVVAADPFVDFSQFDNDGPDGIPSSGDDDGIVDALFVVHAGQGREQTGCDCDIHSHAWNMVNPVAVDGVIASSYSMEPEDGRRGVFGHEFGHVLGLPDLYDTDYSSSGVGDWCMMSFGSWGGGGLTPVHFLSWCKEQLGFLTPTTPLTNIAGASIPQAETSPVAFRLWTGGYPQKESFYVENRQRVLSDISLPGSGLVICHVDETVSSNEDENHPLVKIEQADGLDELRTGGASDAGDPWPGSTAHTTFDDSSNPSTRDYAGAPTQVAVTSISAPSPSMTADLQVENAAILLVSHHALLEVSGNGDGDLDPGEQWQMPVRLFNRGLAGSGITATLTTADPNVTIQSGVSGYGTIEAESEGIGSPAFLQTLGAGSTTDGVAFDVAMQENPGSSRHEALIVGVNDPLRAFQWAHEAVSPGYGDQWHLSTQRNHTPGGSYSWKCGAVGDGSYANLLDAALTTIPLPLASVDAFRFWHRIVAEIGSDQTAWDGGIVEASVDGGAWTQISPDGGYPYTIIANPASPFEPGTPCFSGFLGWTEARFDLSGLAGQSVRLRFRFGTDGYTAGEGWYIDDPSIEGTLPSSVAEGAGLSSPALLAPPRPNPAAEFVLSFFQPPGRSARLAVLDLAGRMLAEWSYPATGEGGPVSRQPRWDGRLPDGRRAASGVYFVRLDAGGIISSQRIVLVR